VLRLAEEQVNVVRHDDVGVEEQAMSLADGFEGLLEDSAGRVVVEVGMLVEAGEGDEVIVAGGLVSLEAAGHGVDGSTGRGGAGFWCSPLMPQVRGREWGTRD